MIDANFVIKQQTTVESLEKRMETLARENPIAGMGMPEEYFETLRQYQHEKAKLNELLNKKAENKRRKAFAAQDNKKFVNSFGEATNREITSLAYQRTMKRKEKEILQFLGK